MIRTPMPSPRGTNHERAFLSPGSRVGAAYDAAPDDEPMDYTALFDFLREKLDTEDLTKVAQMLGVDVETTGMDKRRRIFSGASDERAAFRAAHPDFRRADAAAREQHRLGAIGDGELQRRLNAHQVPRSNSLGKSPPYDAANFPHRDRLK